MKNTLAENMLRFGSKNLDPKSVKNLQKLAEQAENQLAITDVYRKLPVGQPREFKQGFVTPKALYSDERGDGNVGWNQSIVTRLNDGDILLIMGNRMNKTDLKYYPTISITQGENGIEILNAKAMTIDLKTLLSTMLKMNVPPTETDYTNIFKAIAGYLKQYIKMNTKEDLDTLAASIPNSTEKVNIAAAALGIQPAPKTM
jgi:hypothetical protein